MLQKRAGLIVRQFLKLRTPTSSNFGIRGLRLTVFVTYLFVCISEWEIITIFEDRLFERTIPI